MLILDVQDDSLDIAVLISHNLGNGLSYINNLKILGHISNFIFIDFLLNLLCLYLFNFNFALLFDLTFQLLNKWIDNLNLLNVLVKFRQQISLKMSFIKYHTPTAKAYLSIP